MTPNDVLSERLRSRAQLHVVLRLALWILASCFAAGWILGLLIGWADP